MLAVDDSFPKPTPTALANAGKRLAAVPDGQTVIVDGLALGGMPELIENAADRLCIIALIHHPLAAETGLSWRAAESLRQAEMRALTPVHRVIATSLAVVLIQRTPETACLDAHVRVNARIKILRLVEHVDADRVATKPIAAACQRLFDDVGQELREPERSCEKWLRRDALQRAAYFSIQGTCGVRSGVLVFLPIDHFARTYGRRDITTV